MNKAWQKGLEAAIQQAEKSLKEGGIPIGSALLDGKGNIIAAGHNQRVQKGDTTAHAEVDCIRAAGRRRDWNTMTLISTLSPCAMCTGTTVLHQIPRVVIGENESFQGPQHWLEENGIEVTNLNNQRCKDLMREFMDKYPDLWNEDIGIPPEAA